MNNRPNQTVLRFLILSTALLVLSGCGGGSGDSAAQQNNKATVNVTVKVLK